MAIFSRPHHMSGRRVKFDRLAAAAAADEEGFGEEGDTLEDIEPQPHQKSLQTIRGPAQRSEAFGRWLFIFHSFVARAF